MQFAGISPVIRRRTAVSQPRTPATKSSNAVLSPRSDLRSSVPIKKSNRRNSRNPRRSSRPTRAKPSRQSAEDRQTEAVIKLLGRTPLMCPAGRARRERRRSRRLASGRLREELLPSHRPRPWWPHRLLRLEAQCHDVDHGCLEPGHGGVATSPGLASRKTESVPSGLPIIR
jgi:hypothetical protein